MCSVHVSVVIVLSYCVVSHLPSSDLLFLLHGFEQHFSTVRAAVLSSLGLVVLICAESTVGISLARPQQLREKKKNNMKRV